MVFQHEIENFNDDSLQIDIEEETKNVETNLMAQVKQEPES